MRSDRLAGRCFEFIAQYSHFFFLQASLARLLSRTALVSRSGEPGQVPRWVAIRILPLVSPPVGSIRFLAPAVRASSRRLQG